MKKGTKFLIHSAFRRVPSQEIEFEGIQEVGVAGFPNFAIYTISVDLPGHPAGSTLSRIVLEDDFGYVFPAGAS